MTDEKKDEKKKIRINPVEYVMVCDYASLSVGGKLNLNGIFERFLAKEVPVVHPQMFVVSKLILPKGDHKVTFTLMQQDKVLAKSELEKTVEQQLAVHNHFWGVKNLEMETWEPVELQILIDGKQVLVKRMPVMKVEDKGGKK